MFSFVVYQLFEDRRLGGIKKLEILSYRDLILLYRQRVLTFTYLPHLHSNTHTQLIMAIWNFRSYHSFQIWSLRLSRVLFCLLTPNKMTHWLGRQGNRAFNFTWMNLIIWYTLTPLGKIEYWNIMLIDKLIPKSSPGICKKMFSHF